MFQAEWGGGVFQQKKPTKGGLMLWRWNIGASKAIPFLEFAVNHSIVKRKQAEIGLQLARLMSKYTSESRRGVAASRGQKRITEEEHVLRGALVKEMRSLNGARSRFGDSL